MSFNSQSSDLEIECYCMTDMNAESNQIISVDIICFHPKGK